MREGPEVSSAVHAVRGTVRHLAVREHLFTDASGELASLNCGAQAQPGRGPGLCDENSD
jgi:hypothetical protein